MTSSLTRYLILPGWQGSGPEHWQTHWQQVLPNTTRVEQADWQHPDPHAWIDRLEHAITAEPTPVILIAHSLGCITVAHWASRSKARSLAQVRGALLVAPADVERENCPPALQGFAPIPQQPLPFPSLLVGSSNDPAASPQRAIELSQSWASHSVILEQAGHINVSAGFTHWSGGFRYLYQLQHFIEQQSRQRA